jgi:pyrroloquinoline quinone biosynthesis protein B
MLKIVVLGAAAGGGFPQWNCTCASCRAAWSDPGLRDTQTSLALSSDGRNWLLVNASPDIRQQILETPQLHPRGLRHSPIAGVVLTNGEVDAVAGLLSLREGSPFAVFGHERVLSVLDQNSIFNVLDRDLVPRIPIALDTPFEPCLPDGSPTGLTIEAFEVPGKPAWYLEGTSRAGDGEVPGDTLGLSIRAGDGPPAFVIAACGRVTEDLADRLRGAALVMFDGTLWQDDELIRAGLGRKTGKRMGHLSISGEAGTIEALGDLGIGRRVFVHINNSNPALLPGSRERQALEAAGWQVPRPGEELTL